jgi:hypothetical protein
LHGGSFLGSLKINDVQSAAAANGKLANRLDRIVSKNSLTSVVTLLEPHAAASPKIDCRPEFHGEGLLSSGSDLVKKESQQPHAAGLTFFRMELGRQQAAPSYGRAERLTIIGLGNNQFWISRTNVIRVNEVEKRGRLTSECRSGSTSRPPPHFIPAHVGHLIACWQFESGDVSSEDRQSIMTASLPAGLKEQLKAHADPQKWSIGCQMPLDRINETPLDEGPHRIGKGAHPG